MPAAEARAWKNGDVILTVDWRKLRAEVKEGSGASLVVGCNNSARNLRKASHFWHKVWAEAGYPSSGVLTSIKIQAKKRYNYEVRRLKRRQQFLLQDRLAHLFASKKKTDFWAHVNRLIKPHFLIDRPLLMVLVCNQQ